MLIKEQLYNQNTMPEWNDISLSLYKEFSIDCLFDKTFRYYLENQQIIDVQFKKRAMKHLWAIHHHIDSRIDKNKLFEYIDNGLNISHLRESPTMRKWLNDNKDRIRMFACIYQIMKTGAVFYVENGKLSGTDRIDYIKSKSISGKGVHLGMRYEEGVYVPLTLLIDRAINPTKTVEKLAEIKVQKLEIIENKKIIETIDYYSAKNE